ncbi:hypothetical protein [Kitasatospora sp. NPDC001175]|uniref:hypothetical protein n=1 Tax=Kitasatospora sp. NPDC001175 TaxID=3157103 RepID=UPI003D046731
MAKWNERSADEQQEARALRASLARAGIGASLSQIAKEWDVAGAWAAGSIPLEQLLRQTGWTETTSKPDQSRDAPDDPAAASECWMERRRKSRTWTACWSSGALGSCLIGLITRAAPTTRNA